jgi:hypothetical protein
VSRSWPSMAVLITDDPRVYFNTTSDPHDMNLSSLRLLRLNGSSFDVFVHCGLLPFDVTFYLDARHCFSIQVTLLSDEVVSFIH